VKHLKFCHISRSVEMADAEVCYNRNGQVVCVPAVVPNIHALPGIVEATVPADGVLQTVTYSA
jgi:hypothetical protein